MAQHMDFHSSFRNFWGGGEKTNTDKKPPDNPGRDATQPTDQPTDQPTERPIEQPTNNPGQ